MAGLGWVAGLGGWAWLGGWAGLGGWSGLVGWAGYGSMGLVVWLVAMGLKNRFRYILHRGIKTLNNQGGLTIFEIIVVLFMFF